MYRLLPPPCGNHSPSDSQVITRQLGGAGTHYCGLCRRLYAGRRHPGQIRQTDGYHMEHGFSRMGYEVAAGIGVQHIEVPTLPERGVCRRCVPF